MIPRSRHTVVARAARAARATHAARAAGATHAARAARACAPALSAMACVLLAVVLALGLVPPALFATPGPVMGAHVAYAADDDDDDGGDDGEGDDGEDEEEQQRREEEERLEADRQAAREVDDLIDSLPSAGNATADDRNAADNALAAYERLTSDQQDLVQNADKLFAVLDAVSAAEEELARQEEEERAAAEKEAADKQAAQAVCDLIAALPDAAQATEDDKDAAQAAKDAFDQLTDDQQALVPAADREKLSAVLDAVNSQPETYYVQTLLLQWDTPDAQGEKHFVGDSSVVERDYKKIHITDYGINVQLNGWYLSTDGTRTAYQTADSTTAIGQFDLTWESSDPEVATVSPTGNVSPRGKNGTVTITATVADERVYQGQAPQATVTIEFDGQEGKYVKKVEILDDTGNVIGKTWGGVTVYDEQNTFHQLHARVTWYNVVDKTETVEETGTGDDYDASRVGTTLVWNVSTSEAFTINEDTGRLRCGSYSGSAYVTCTAVGGLKGQEVEDTAGVQLDTGVYRYNPASSLQLRVVWEERPDEVVKEHTYSYSELLSLLPSKKINATVVNSSRYGVITAEGFLFKDVVDLVAVDDADVLQYRFSTADGYDNPVSYKYLFESGNRYYFPNYDIGSRAEGEIVPPILAYKSAMEWNRSEANPNATLDEGTRFRLVFGCLASGDSNTSSQIYYINGITIVLKGAPSAGGGGGGGSQDKSGSSSGKGAGASSSAAASSGQSEDPASGDASGASAESGSKSSGSGGSKDKGGTAPRGQEQSAGRSSGSAGVSDQGADASASAAASDPQGDQAQQDEAGSSEADTAAGTDLGSSKRWRVYQMMNKNNSDVPDWDDENPISPFAAPVALGTFAIGVGATGIGFRRRLK